MVKCVCGDLVMYNHDIRAEKRAEKYETLVDAFIGWVGLVLMGCVVVFIGWSVFVLFYLVLL